MIAAKKYLSTEGALLSKIPDHLTTQDLLLDAVFHQPDLVGQLVPDQIDDLVALEACVAAVSVDGLVLGKIHSRWRVEEVYRAAVTQTHQAMHWVPDHAKTEELCVLAASHGCLWAVPGHRRSIPVCLAAMSRCSSNAHYVDWDSDMIQAFQEAGLGGFVPTGRGELMIQD